MAQEQFYIAHSGQQEGPFSVDEISKRLKAQALVGTDYVYDESQSDWIMLMSHDVFTNIAKSSKPAAQPLTPPPQSQTPSQEQTTPTIEEWFVLKGDLRFGPFATTEVVRLLQEKSLALTDYVWTPAMKSWERVGDVPTFSTSEVRRMKESGVAGVNETFFARRHRRIPYGASLLVHDNRKLFKGQGIEISEGGAAFTLENPSLEQGQKIFLHFKPDAELPSFNAYCEVVSRRQIKASDQRSNQSIQYGIKFLRIDHTTAEKIQKLTQKRQAA